MRQIVWGEQEIVYHIERVPRKTVAITVRPDSSVIVRAPLNVEDNAVERLLQKRASWVIQQQRFFDQFRPRTTPREYIGGETHLYLGRRYRLRLREEETKRTALIGGYLYVFAPKNTDKEQIKSQLDAWYAERANEVFAERLRYCRRIAALKDLPEPRLRIRNMSKRWGSCSSSKLLSINTDLIRAPRRCIDYVIVHELCHLIHHNHSQDFYHLLSVIMPDWKERKMKLEILLS